MEGIRSVNARVFYQELCSSFPRATENAIYTAFACLIMQTAPVMPRSQRVVAPKTPIESKIGATRVETEAHQVKRPTFK
jgi:hypothetical protein